MNLEFLPGPGVEVLVQVAGGVGKGSEDEYFAVGFAVAIDGGLTDFGLDELLEFGELAVAFGGDGLGFLQQKLKLSAVIADRLQPLGEFEWPRWIRRRPPMVKSSSSKSGSSNWSGVSES